MAIENLCNWIILAEHKTWSSENTKKCCKEKLVAKYYIILISNHVNFNQIISVSLIWEYYDFSLKSILQYLKPQ